MTDALFFCLAQISLTLLLVDSYAFSWLRVLITDAAYEIVFFRSDHGEIDEGGVVAAARHFVSCYACVGFWVGLFSTLRVGDYKCILNGLVVSLLAAIVGTGLKYLRLVDAVERNSL